MVDRLTDEKLPENGIGFVLEKKLDNSIFTASVASGKTLQLFRAGNAVSDS
jgi:hypothetical protein